jgi:hypothetical protein
MKKLVVFFATIVLLSLTTSAENHYYGVKMQAMTNVALSKSIPASPTPDPCTCSCGKNCNGSCTANVSGCGLVDGLRCIYDCCQQAPNPGKAECGGDLE